MFCIRKNKEIQKLKEKNLKLKKDIYDLRKLLFRVDGDLLFVMEMLEDDKGRVRSILERTKIDPDDKGY